MRRPALSAAFCSFRLSASSPLFQVRAGRRGLRPRPRGFRRATTFGGRETADAPRAGRRSPKRTSKGEDADGESARSRAARRAKSLLTRSAQAPDFTPRLARDDPRALNQSQ
jgi:hypothetical protein